MSIPKHAVKVFEGIAFDVYHYEQELFDGSKKTFEKLTRPNTIDIIAINENGQILILEEEQPGRPKFYGLVGGTCEMGETSLETAKRELLEETGMQSDEWELFNEYPRRSRILYTSHVFIARNCKQIQAPNPEAGEKIKIHPVGWEDFLSIVAHPEFRVAEFALEVLRAIFLKKESELREKILLDQGANALSLSFLGKKVIVKIDRPLGSKHPKHDFIYPVNYGYIPNTISGDNEELDAYVLGISEPVKEFFGTCIAIIHRTNDNDDKLIVVPDGGDFTDEQIREAINFQEQYFESEIIR